MEGDKEIEKYLALGTVRKKDLQSFGLFHTKEGFVPFVVSSQPQLLQWGVFAASEKLQGEREIAYLMTTFEEKLCYAKTEPISFKVQGNDAMHTLTMLMLTLTYTLEVLKLEL